MSDDYSDEEYTIEQPPTSPAADKSFQTTGTNATNPDASSPSCWTRFKAEINPCQAWFVVADPASHRKIDVPESFAPSGRVALFSKLVITVFCLATLVVTWIQTSSAEFFLAYLTNWGQLMSCLYVLCSLWNTLWSSRTLQPPDRATCFIRTTWVLFEMAAHTEVIVTLLYWLLVYDGGPVDFVEVAPHSVLCVLVWIDGLVINRIPVRWTHYFGFVLTLDIIYVVWSILQSPLVFDIGNPGVMDNDPETNDDTIYRALDWEDDPGYSAILATIVVFVVGPAIYLVLWLVSAYKWPCCFVGNRRRYIDSYNDYEEDTRPRVDDVEEGSIFAKWW